MNAVVHVTAYYMLTGRETHCVQRLAAGDTRWAFEKASPIACHDLFVAICDRNNRRSAILASYFPFWLQ